MASTPLAGYDIAIIRGVIYVISSSIPLDDFIRKLPDPETYFRTAPKNFALSSSCSTRLWFFSENSVALGADDASGVPTTDTTGGGIWADAVRGVMTTGAGLGVVF